MKSGNGVLVVDDDPDMVEVLADLLRDAGYQVRTARNGAEALAAVAESRPSLVLLDMLMPVMDGWHCAKHLRELGDHIPIVIVTAAEHARSRAEEIGADGALAKPFEVDNLLSMVARFATPSG